MAGCSHCVAVVWCSHCQRFSTGDRRGSFMCCPTCGKVLADVIRTKGKRHCSADSVKEKPISKKKQGLASRVHKIKAENPAGKEYSPDDTLEQHAT